MGHNPVATTADYQSTFEHKPQKGYEWAQQMLSSPTGFGKPGQNDLVEQRFKSSPHAPDLTAHPTAPNHTLVIFQMILGVHGTLGLERRLQQPQNKMK